MSRTSVLKTLRRSSESLLEMVLPLSPGQALERIQAAVECEPRVALLMLQKDLRNDELDACRFKMYYFRWGLSFLFPSLEFWCRLNRFVSWYPHLLDVSITKDSAGCRLVAKSNKGLFVRVVFFFLLAWPLACSLAVYLVFLPKLADVPPRELLFNTVLGLASRIGSWGVVAYLGAWWMKRGMDSAEEKLLEFLGAVVGNEANDRR